MPHINRIRVNNVKYNFGTQVYDDFVMRFSCKNTIYDLANGGGKSVLMLLLLQNLIPNCTLDEKQPVEKLFRTSSGSNTIHSLIEWKLDSCYQKNNFKYMTTGFCARKGKDDGENANRESANIEYFNYCIFYREFGDNDIKNLPLSKNGEKVTYNGLKGYLRDLEHKDHSVEVHLFERKGDYQTFISQYGLFESEWEIIRGINKTEGHVRTYFENNYRTGRKVVEDLLIEEIIQKSFNNQTGNQNEDDGMAKTLLDIKDKIMELSKRKEEMNTFDRQISLMMELSEKIVSFKEYQEEKENIKNALLEKLSICRTLLEQLSKEVEQEEESRILLQEDYQNEDKLVSIAKILDDEKELAKLSGLVADFNEQMEALVRDEKDLHRQILLAEGAEYYFDLKKYEAQRDEVLLTMDSRMRDNGEVYEEIHALASSAKQLLDVMAKENEEQLRICLVKEQEACQEYQRVKEAKENTELKAATAQGGIQTLVNTLEQKELTLKEYVAQSGVLLAEQADDQMAAVVFEIQNEKAKLQSSLDESERLEEKLAECNQKISECDTEWKICEHEKQHLERNLEQTGINQKKINSMASIYGESEPGRLTNAIYTMYKNSIRLIADLEIKMASLNDYYNNLSEGRYVFDGHQYARVEEYLFNTYGEDVMYGYQWFNTLTAAQQRDVMKRVPFYEYGFVILGDFERIREDINLRNFSHSSYIVPIISEMILRDTRHAASVDYMVFGTKDLSFLRDAGKVEAELDSVRNELYNREEELKRLKGNQEVFWDDYLYMLSTFGKNVKNLQEDYDELQKKMERLQTEKEALVKEQQELLIVAVSMQQNQNEIKESLEEKEKSIALLEKTKLLYDEINHLYEQKKQLQTESESLSNLTSQYQNSETKCYDSWQEAIVALNVSKHKKEELEAEWKNIFAPYYSDEYESLKETIEYEQLRTRFNALVAVINHENVDLSDKKELLKTYEENIEKCIRNIKNRNLTLEEVAEFVAGTTPAANEENVRINRERMQKIQEQLRALQRENDAQNAQMNRMEGSLTHARGLIEEKYGAFELFECENTRQFIAEHTSAKKAMEEQIKDLEKDIRRKNAKLSEITVIDKDMERMLRNSGVNVPDNIHANCVVEESDLQDYEQIQKDYDRLMRNEYRKKDDFNKEKRRITDLLKECNALDLAEEVERSIQIPDSVLEIDEMQSNIKETCDCIALEKERVSKGIDDMERIKENFESRCIQTCANIKAELDRLPKLSKITLDNEVISMIGLNIPYVKEEFYRERMSAYINDTVAFSENFKTEEERMQYIRTRLSWKKLFSVIVTDMNAIRLNLYKRERIKDQSRYLRYEEAVGSTGQSQGIYIQFLIAIINYISNINAAGKEVSSIGKVVFIDNPFGAAKDVYIWEPIFKLLKTNHVQLIVPARGATPAITAKFDVNYILGQKLVNGRQQTVVVDYRSQVPNDELEYTRLDYNQESLF